MPLLGVDVSSYAGTAVDWAKVANAGFTFAINRACLDLRPDPTWARNTAEARKHGLIAGAYHFLYPSGGSGSAAQPAAAQCDAFLKVIGNPEGLIVALDVESDGGGVYQPTFADVKAWVARFREKHPTHPLLIYTGAWYWNSSSHPIHDADASGLGRLWDSRYVAVSSPRTAQHLYASVPASWWTPGFGGWPRVTVLQFSSSAAVPGVAGNCDVSAFAGTIEQLRALASAAPAPAPAPEEIVKTFAVSEQRQLVPPLEDPARPGHSYWLYTTSELKADGKEISLDPKPFRPLVVVGPNIVPGVTAIAYETAAGDVDGSSWVYFIATDHLNWAARIVEPSAAEAKAAGIREGARAVAGAGAAKAKELGA